VRKKKGSYVDSYCPPPARVKEGRRGCWSNGFAREGLATTHSGSQGEEEEDQREGNKTLAVRLIPAPCNPEGEKNRRPKRRKRGGGGRKAVMRFTGAMGGEGEGKGIVSASQKEVGFLRSLFPLEPEKKRGGGDGCDGKGTACEKG